MEAGSTAMISFAQTEEDSNKIVSVFAGVEARSAMTRLHKGGRMTADDLSSSLRSLSAEIARITEEPCDAGVLLLAHSMIDQHALRTLDAIQLASAISARVRLNARTMRFIASDLELLRAAEHQGFAIWNPPG